MKSPRRGRRRTPGLCELAAPALLVAATLWLPCPARAQPPDDEAQIPAGATAGAEVVESTAPDLETTDVQEPEATAPDVDTPDPVSTDPAGAGAPAVSSAAEGEAEAVSASAPAATVGSDPAGAIAVPPRARIGDVRIVTKGIFDPSEPGEDRRLFRLANRLHRTTRPHVVAGQLLFRTGDPYSPEVMEETERLLRANRYLYDAEVRTVRTEGDVVDVEVVTRDVWTLQAGLSLNRAGGENSTQFSLEDSNFLGTGKDMTLWRIENVDRTSTLLRYRDPHLLGTRAQMEASWAEYSDGGAQRFELERPFFSLDSRWAGGIKAWRYDRIDSLYDRGLVFTRFQHERDWMELYGGLSPGLVEGGARRLQMGLTVERNRFDFAPGGDSDSLVPPNRTLVYPWIGYQYVEDGFVAERDLDRLQRTEDLNLGRQLQARLGWSTESFGADSDSLVFDSALSTGWRPGRRQLVLASAFAGSRWGDDGAENLLVSGRARYYLRAGSGGLGRRLPGEHVFYAAVEADFARRLDLENQLLLGGDSGLRGYPLRYQQGDRRFLVTLEQRFFGDRELFHLVHVGAAVFFDAGRAWFEDVEGARREEVLKDIGFGLRLGSSRSAQGTVVHLDLAFPLDRDDSIESVQWLVLTRDSF